MKLKVSDITIDRSLLVREEVDRETQTFTDAITFDVQKAMRLLIRGSINVGHGINPRSQQTFLTIAFSELEKSGCVLHWLHKPPKQQMGEPR